MKIGTFIFLFFTLFLFKSKPAFNQSQETDGFHNYTLEIKWQDNDFNTNLLCLNSGKRLMLKDTCAPDSTNTCKFTLDVKKYPKGLYTLIKMSNTNDRNKDIYLNIVLDKDSLIKLNVFENQNVKIIESKDNLIFYEFIHKAGELYKKMQDVYSSGANNQQTKDSIKYYTEAIKTLNTQYTKKYPNHIVSVLVKIQDILEEIQTPINYKDATDSLNNTQRMRNTIISLIR